MLFYIDPGFNDAKYEMLAICLRLKQNSSKLLREVIIYWKSSYLLRKKHSQILAKLKAKILGEENFAEFNFVIHDRTHRNLFRKKVKKYALLTKNATIFWKSIQKMGTILKHFFRKIQCFRSTEWQ